MHCFGRIHVERFITPEAAANSAAVEVYATVELHAAEMECDSFAAGLLRHGETAAEPCPLIIHALEIPRDIAAIPFTADWRVAQLRHDLVLPGSVEADFEARLRRPQSGEEQTNRDGAGDHLAHFVREVQSGETVRLGGGIINTIPMAPALVNQ